MKRLMIVSLFLFVSLFNNIAKAQQQYIFTTYDQLLAAVLDPNNSATFDPNPPDGTFRDFNLPAGLGSGGASVDGPMGQIIMSLQNVPSGKVSLIVDMETHTPYFWNSVTAVVFISYYDPLTNTNGILYNTVVTNVTWGSRSWHWESPLLTIPNPMCVVTAAYASGGTGFYDYGLLKSPCTWLDPVLLDSLIVF